MVRLARDGAGHGASDTEPNKTPSALGKATGLQPEAETGHPATQSPSSKGFYKKALVVIGATSPLLGQLLSVAREDVRWG